jgi:hypothetical protein
MNREFDMITSPESIFNPRTFKFCQFWTDIVFSTALGYHFGLLLQAPLQVTNPVSSGVGYQYDSGGEEGKSDSTSWKERPLETGSGDREEESQIQIKPQAAPAAADQL